jgi:hypothetical protein
MLRKQREWIAWRIRIYGIRRDLKEFKRIARRNLDE